MEGDDRFDEISTATYDVAELPLLKDGILGPERQVIFPDLIDDGDYRLSSCNFSHHLEPLSCGSNADCNVPLKCIVGICR
jgi:hypothetical protein